VDRSGLAFTRDDKAPSAGGLEIFDQRAEPGLSGFWRRCSSGTRHSELSRERSGKGANV
jgi:hypothetical protein